MSIINKRLLAIPCSIVLMLVACSTDNTPKPEAMPKVTNEVTLKQGWRKSALEWSYNPSSFAPIIFDGAVFVADSDGNILKLDPSDGSVIQRYKVPSQFDVSSGVGVSGSSLFVTTKKGQLISIDKSSGKLNWQVSLPTVSLETPQVARDIVVVRTNDAQLIAFNANTGATLWVYQRPIPSLTLRSLNTFTIIANEVIAAGLPGGKLALINLFSGTAIWENYIAIPSGATDLDKITDIAMRPMFRDKLICVATFNGKISCVDAMSSNILWQKTFSSSQGVVIDDQNVYA
ncbi:MAG: PQQ-binding-like beta-propeller repeat protein, partial [Burkholderiales bacterium]|nr:PQQ-binding-like beta-propeller repeat protein [Burkholderiales bacterium]